MRRRIVSVWAGLALLLGVAAAPANAGLLGADASADWTLGGKPCRLIEVPAASAAPVGIGPCPGVRPGAVVRTEAGRCTFNFLFTGSDGRRYAGTAGHCVLDDGERSWAVGDGPVASDGAGNRVGEFAYAVLDDPRDFALIRLDPGVEASAQMCHFGGPTGINSDRPGLTTPVVLHHFGQGVAVDATVPGRTALALGMPSEDHVFAEGVAVPGDSGSGVISADGRAVGVLVTLGVHVAGLGTGGIDAGNLGITRLGPQLARAEDSLGVDLTLETAPLL